MKCKYFSSLIELKQNVGTLQNGDFCETMGYYQPLDGGRGKYLVKQDSTSANDDGYIVRLTDSLIANLVIENNEINALQYGAHPNWTQYPNEPEESQWHNFDNKVIFKKIRDKAAGIKCNIYIPKGIYVCVPTRPEDELLTVAPGITLRGDGDKTVITIPTIDETAGISKSYYCAILYCWNVFDFKVRDITLDGNRHLKPDGTYFGGTGMNGIRGVDVADWDENSETTFNATFENVTVKNCMHAGFRIINSNKLSFRGCKCINVDCGFITMGNKRIYDIVIDGCYVDGHSMSEGISLFSTGGEENIVISNNIIKNKDNGLAILVGLGDDNIQSPLLNKNITITGNILTDTAVGIGIYNASHVNISGNIIGRSLTGNNMSIHYSKDIVVNGNQLYYCANDSVNIADSSHILICNNIIKDNKYDKDEMVMYFGYFMIRNSSCLTIKDNHIYQELTPAVKSITIGPDVNKLVFCGNDIYNDYRSNTITEDQGVMFWFDGNNEDICLKNSYIEMPANSKFYSNYPPVMDETRNHSNTVFRRTDVLTPYVYNENTDMLARCCIIDPIASSLSSLAIKPLNTRLLLIFKNDRGYDTELRNDGNIRFKDDSRNNCIEKSTNCIIELISMDTYWVELSRTCY